MNNMIFENYSKRIEIKEKKLPRVLRIKNFSSLNKKILFNFRVIITKLSMFTPIIGAVLQLQDMKHLLGKNTKMAVILCST